MEKIKITMADGKYTIIEARDTRQEYPGVKIPSSTECQRFIARMYSPEGSMINGMAITELRRKQAIEGAKGQGLTVEEC